ncbi:MAG: universal stress protein [Chloroflexi bacterium]|nr:MAG: universal stress protein [Chloroflexota bacterium]
MRRVGAMRVLVLINGLHTRELFDPLERLLQLDEAELLLVYVRGPGPRAGLDLVRHGPGGRPLPPRRERELADAELAGSASALAEAELRANAMVGTVKSIQLDGEPGRAVCDVAARERVDLIVIRAGGRDQPPIGTRSLGPVGRFVVDHSPCPVLLLRSHA